MVGATPDTEAGERRCEWHFIKPGLPRFVSLGVFAHASRDLSIPLMTII
jgi:hypothetical protein